jgi:hypothetical protein
MVAMQNSIIYDPSKLTFSSVQNFNIPQLDAGDFNGAQSGYLLNVWLETSLTPVFLGNGDLLYQIVFEMTGNEPGEVCFSEDPLVYEFVRSAGDLASFMIQDPCHSTPFLIELTVSMEEMREKYGISVMTLLNDRQVVVTCEKNIRAFIRLHDISGREVWASPVSQFSAGEHRLQTSAGLSAGVYVLSVVVDDRIASTKVLKD